MNQPVAITIFLSFDVIRMLSVFKSAYNFFILNLIFLCLNYFSFLPSHQLHAYMTVRRESKRSQTDINRIHIKV